MCKLRGAAGAPGYSRQDVMGNALNKVDSSEIR